MFDETGGGGSNLTQAESDQMRSAAIDAGETAERLELMLRNLNDNLSPLLTQWTGTAGTTFQQVQTALGEQITALHRALTTIADDVGVSAELYQVTDEEAAEHLASVGNMDAGEVTRLLDGNTTEVSQAVQSGASQSEITNALTTS
jgi:WXG100 family type VII secretion target